MLRSNAASYLVEMKTNSANWGSINGTFNCHLKENHFASLKVTEMGFLREFGFQILSW